MSAVFGEILKFGQGAAGEVTLRVTGDEFYATYETLDGYSVVNDADRELFCYALLVNGALVSSGVPATEPVPVGVPRHLRESVPVRARRFQARRASTSRPPNGVMAEVAFTLGPSQGLLEGRRLSVGNVRGLTILVEFQDVGTTVTSADVDGLLNADDYHVNGNFCSARQYFRTVSSNKLDYRNDVVGPFKLSQNRSFYVQNLLVKEALDLAVEAGVDLRKYDSRNEGIIDALNIMYAGQTQYTGNLWPHNSELHLQYGTVRTNLYLLTSVGRTAADLSIGTFCHENGHLLCRFPDMYDYGDVTREGDGVKSAGIGSYCLMGSGNHLDSGRTPAPVCAYLRELAGWCDKKVLLNGKTEVSAEHGAYDTILKYETASPNEYFIVENRSKLGLDSFLPASGLAVYHCDIFGSNELQNGTAQKHYQCALLQADGHRDLEVNNNQGDGTDLFGGVSGVALSNTSTPSSRLWGGADSGLLLSNIGVPARAIGFRVGAVSSNLSLHAENTVSVVIPDANEVGISSKIHVERAGKVEKLVVKVDIRHTYIGDLMVELEGPSGARVVLHGRSGGSGHDLSIAYDSSSVAALQTFVGSSVQGDWLLRVRDLDKLDTGTLLRWSLDAQVQGTAGLAKGQASPKLAIPENNPAGISSSIALADKGTIGRLKVGVSITHTYIGDLRIELVAPSGRSVVLHGQLGEGADNIDTTYDSATPLSALAGLVGQGMEGSWTLRVADLAPQDVGTLNSWSLEITPM
jgi:M6 family metalloprotease-like protein